MERKLHTIHAEQFKFDAVKGSFEGYASMFDGVDAYGDTIVKGAYAETLQNRTRPVAMFFNHISRRSDMPAKIGVYEDMQEDDYGLKVKGRLTVGHPTADAVLASMKNGTISGLSIGYMVPAGGAEKRDNIRLLKKIDLIEVSIVEEPADLGALIDRSSIKNAVDEMKSLACAEKILREAGNFSGNAATDFVSKLRAVIQREAGDAGSKSEGLSLALQEAMRDLKPLTMKHFGE